MTPICPLTGTEMRPWLQVPGDWRRPQLPVRYQLYWSDAAQYGELHPRPSAEELAAAYAIDYYTHTPAAPVVTGGPAYLLHKVREHLAWRVDRGTSSTEWLVRYFRGRAPGRVCDLGAGNGETAAAVAATGQEVTCIEPDPRAREVIAQRGLKVLAGSAGALPTSLPRPGFEVVYLIHVLEHVAEPRRLLEEVRALLVPGGELLVEVPNNAALGAKIAGPLWRWLDVPRHLNFFTEPSLRRMLMQAGLQVMEVHYLGYFRQLHRAWIRDERAAYDLYHHHLEGPLPPRNGLRRSFRLLAQTAFAPPERKYDSLLVRARRS